MNENVRWLFLIIAVVILFTLPDKETFKQSVADMKGKPCVTNDDCPCWGLYNQSSYTTQSYGLGVATCKANMCDTTYCANIQPIGEWTRDHPWAYIRDNPIWFILIALFVAVAIFWDDIRRYPQ